MLHTLEIENFRCFDRFALHGLARVNVLVGANNSGKTALLEALELWATRRPGRALCAIIERRGESHMVLEPDVQHVEFSVPHLFHGHTAAPRHEFSITGSGAGVHHFVRGTLEVERAATPAPLPGPRVAASAPEGSMKLVLRTGGVRVQGTEMDSTPIFFPLGPKERFRLPISVVRQPVESDRAMCHVTAGGLSAHDVSAMLGDVLLTDQEDLITSALQTVEPTIERIAPVPGATRSNERGSIVIKCMGQSQRVPISSMGEGMWRILGLALGLVTVRDGILLVDVIDGGLHHSVMDDMWRLVTQTAQQLGCQVFATTHSRDCLDSLARILSKKQNGACSVAVHRIERKKGRTVHLDEQEFVTAIEQGIEVR
jgi:hypothetical protein